jgi:hypothetical protein
MCTGKWQIVGKRFTWDRVTGKTHELETWPNGKGTEAPEARETEADERASERAILSLVAAG